MSIAQERPIERTSLQHIAIIMDGNGRWAEQRGLERLKGHVEGANALERISEYSNDVLELPYLSLFAFSTENWKRPMAEVNGLLDLFFDYLKKEPDELIKRDVKLSFIGELDEFPDRLRNEIESAISRTRDNKGMQMTVAIGYGGRQEILHATEKILSDLEHGAISMDDVMALDQTAFRSYLYDPELPDPDIIIRTGGEQRISNFFLWQAANSFFWSTPTLWPDFCEDDLNTAIEAYQENNSRRD